MTRTNWIIIGLAYIIGLLLTNLIPEVNSGMALKQWAIFSVILLSLVAVIAIAKQKLSLKAKISPQIWLGSVMVAILAGLYFQLRIPQPLHNDISYQIRQSDRQLVQVTGTVLSEPRLNDRRGVKFSLQVGKMDEEEVSGKLYATLPLLQGTGIYPGQQLDLKGFLYLPPAASNPHGFDFKQYLARQGIFAGIQGTEAKFISPSPNWGWWKLRQRIVRSHLQGLGSPVGQLVSSMVLGGKAVDLPRDLRDRFVEAGLAHVLAASGFQVSLLLGIVLKLTEGIADKPRLAIGIGTLAIYLGLTGVQASILRACLMGVAVLIALTMETKVRPLGSLFAAAVIILLFDPLLINDLGFQLSFLATLGLIVTLPELLKRLDWLPTAIATLVAVPLSASIWVLPLLCYQFNTLATYSIAVNILATPLITVISLIGTLSAIAALIVPGVGSAIAFSLLHPTRLLIFITDFCNHLPANTWAVGQIPLAILLGIYGLFLLIWGNQWWQKHWWLGLLLPIGAIMAIACANSTQIQIAVLPSQQSSTIVVQDHAQVILINSGQANQAKYNVFPFLAQQGINNIDYGLAYDNRANSADEWRKISERVQIKSLFASARKNLPPTQIAIIGQFPEITTKFAHLTREQDLNLIHLHMANANWLILGKPESLVNPQQISQKIADYIKQHLLRSQPSIIVSSGDIATPWLQLLQPQIAIAAIEQITPKTKELLRQKQIEFLDTASTGIIRWSPRQGFIETVKNNSKTIIFTNY